MSPAPILDDSIGLRDPSHRVQKIDWGSKKVSGFALARTLDKQVERIPRSNTPKRASEFFGLRANVKRRTSCWRG